MPPFLAFAQHATLPMFVAALLLGAATVFIKALPHLKRVEMENDHAFRADQLASATVLDAQTQRHIDRLEEHIERQDKRIREIEERMEECERERAAMRGEIAEMRAMLAARGEIRQQAQRVISAEKYENKIVEKVKGK